MGILRDFIVGHRTPLARFASEYVLMSVTPRVTRSVGLVEALPDARFYVADFPGSTMGFRYSAFDADGKMVESAIS